MTRTFLILVLTWMVSCYSAVYDYGDNCTHSDECYDHRMVCVPDEHNITRCFCDRFHKWNDTIEECLQVYSVSYIMDKTVTVGNYFDKLEEIQENIFKGHVYAIYFMICVIVVATLAIIIFCFYVRKKDNHLKEVVIHLQAVSAERSARTPGQYTYSSRR